MSIKLKRVELKNIRSHEHVIFEPEEAGITAIGGPNGVGKSTIVDSIAWALYGTKPEGTSRAQEIFRDKAGEKDIASATVDLNIDGVDYRIERRRVNKNGAVECEIFKTTYDDSNTPVYTNVAGPAVSHAEIFVRRSLKMDESGFLAAVLVQQKQVDQLISSGPRERGAVIERLTGITAITQALTEATQEAKTLKKAASLSTIDEASFSKLKAEKETVAVKRAEKATEVRAFKAKVTELKTEGASLREKVDREASLEARQTSLNNTISTLQARQEAQQEELARVLVEKDEARASLSTLSTGTSLEELEPKLHELRSSVRASHLNTDRLGSREKELKELVRTTLSIIEEATFASTDVAQKLLSEAQSAKSTALQDKLTLNEERAALLSDSKKLEKAIKVISHGDNCPTCLQKVSEVDEVVSSLTQEKLRAEESAKSKHEESKLREIQAEELSDTIEHLESYLAAQEQIEALQTDLTSVTKDRDIALGEQRVLEGELAGLEKVHREVKAQEERKKGYQKLLLKAQQLTSSIEELGSKIDASGKELKELTTISPAALARLRKSLDELRGRHSQATNGYTAAVGDYRLLQQQDIHLEEKLLKSEEEITRYKDLLKSVEAATAMVELIKEFREERIRNAVPLIEVYASDLINRFTEGKFTRLKLNQKFYATVVLADGQERAVGLLSGGELSVAAMSLRLAISMLLNSGGGENLIVLDEVLVSQDAQRAELILSTVKEVCKGQVILIAHNDIIDSIADKVVAIKPS